jgi:dimethylamine monooxygenase subunit A
MLPTPYDGSSIPFTIGLKPLDPENWLEVDDLLAAYLKEKKRLNRDLLESVFAAEPGTKAAQREVLDLVVDFLTRRYPALYALDAARRTVRVAGETVALDDGPPLTTAARLIQDDLVLMRKGDAGWRLAAASLCFPSSWTLSEKFGRPIHEIHTPVPGFGGGTRNAGLIARIFDNLKPGQPVIRWNWSLQADLSLYRPMSSLQRDGRAVARLPRFPDANPVAAAFIRVERQTLSLLPVSGDILFTIRIHLDPMAALAAHPNRARLAASLAAQLEALDSAQLDYKGLAADRDRLATGLRALAAA